MATTIDGSIHVGAGAPPEFVRYSPDVDSLSPDFGENLDTVQDLTVEWPEQLSSPLAVAKLRIPRQDISGDDNLPA